MMQMVRHNEPTETTLLGLEIDDLLLRVRGLALVRDLLAERGAAPDEVEAHADELERARRRLAGLISGQAPDPDDDLLGDAA